MNNDRRKRIESLTNKLTEIKEEIELLQQEEQDAYDAMPEGIRYSERGDNAESAMAELEEAAEHCQDAATSLETATEY